MKNLLVSTVVALTLACPMAFAADGNRSEAKKPHHHRTVHHKKHHHHKEKRGYCGKTCYKKVACYKKHYHYRPAHQKSSCNTCGWFW
jgi:Ni/Co efflux regulator RcnB